MRNQCRNAPQAWYQLEPGGSGLACIASLLGLPGGELGHRLKMSVSEAMMNARGVVMARVLGHSWVPIPSTDQTVNVGTLSPAPHAVASGHASCGKARRPLVPPGGGGGSVVVRGRESRPHGEGTQFDSQRSDA